MKSRRRKSKSKCTGRASNCSVIYAPGRRRNAYLVANGRDPVDSIASGSREELEGLGREKACHLAVDHSGRARLMLDPIEDER